MDPVPYSLPTSGAGETAPLTYIPNDQDITAANARGKIVVRDVKTNSISYALFAAIGEYLAPGLPTTGDYVRPYLDSLDDELIAAGKAGAAGLIIVWDAPGSQLRGYFDPHTGTRFRVPAVYVGNEQGAVLKRAAQAGRSATVIVRAKWDLTRTRNIFATLRGRSRQRIVVLTHTDGATWVQENGPVGEIALARYFARLPLACRARDVQFALTSGHLSFAYDGSDRYAAELDRDYNQGTVAFADTLEHLGTKEILPQGPNNHLVLTGKPEPIAWSAAQESPVLVKASIAAVKRRNLTATAVLKGVGAPVSGQAPSICSYGGIGTSLNERLIPSIATITGPWSLWAPSFGSNAIDFTRMRNEVIAQGDVIRQLDSVPRATIAGQFTTARQQRAKGQVNTCSLALPPAVAPAH